MDTHIIRDVLDAALSIGHTIDKINRDEKLDLADAIDLYTKIAPAISGINDEVGDLDPEEAENLQQMFKDKFAGIYNDLAEKQWNKELGRFMLESIENPSLDQFMYLAHDFKPLTEREFKKKFVFIIVGLGGTGGYVIRDLSRFAYSVLRRDEEYDLKIVCVDPDEVEEKNLLRQNFMPNDLGKNKAEVMAAKHARAFGLEISSLGDLMTRSTLESITSQFHDYVPVIIGCVDNNKARREIDKFVSKTRKACYWIDSGNERTTGQVVMGSSNGIPTVTKLFPEVLEESADSVSEISCAERLMQDEQNIFVNISAATHVLNMCRKIVLNETGPVHGVKFNIAGKVDTMCLKQAA